MEKKQKQRGTGKKNKGEERNGRYPAPATPTHLAHALSIGGAQGMSKRGCTRYGKYVTAPRKKKPRKE